MYGLSKEMRRKLLLYNIINVDNFLKRDKYFFIGIKV